MSRLAGFLRNPRLVLALGLACALAVSLAWLLRSPAGATPVPVTVAEGTTGSAAGVEWRLIGLVAAETVPSGLSSVEPVPGAVFVLARFAYAGPAGQELYCRVTLAATVGSGPRGSTPRAMPSHPPAVTAVRPAPRRCCSRSRAARWARSGAWRSRAGTAPCCWRERFSSRCRAAGSAGP